ncbi:MAG: phosphate signaling complex protein PhoU [Pirellulales bacterium]|jgi:phosphate transport system protein|nr:phosphate signaling complex protein PhoU [Pirellulales bacterium]|tara:strand:+ start:4739 stop:5413 length:675 start_codon:yes stop_codon:yes gene_type:complete
MARHIEHQIAQLKNSILQFGTIVEESISRSNTALFKQDVELAQKVIADDTEIDRLEVELEEECLKVLALYQPVAADLRFVVAVLKINNDLERIGDLASNIAKTVSQLTITGPLELPEEISSMAKQVEEMVKNSLDAVVKANPDLARQVRKEDDIVDAGRHTVRKLVIQQIKKDPEKVEGLLQINSISKHLERIADMATNIAEDVIYMVEGEIVRHRHRDDVTST